MVPVQDFLRPGDVLVLLGPQAPGHVQEPVQIAADHGGLRRERRHPGEPGYFPLRLVPRLVAHQGGVHPLRVAKLLLALLLLAELVLDDAQLLPQIVFLLLLVDDGAHAVLNVVLQLQDVYLLRQETQQEGQGLLHVLKLQEGLTILQLRGYVRADQVDELPQVVQLRDGGHHLVRDAGLQGVVALEAVEDAPPPGLQFCRFRLNPGHGDHVRRQDVLVQLVFPNPHPGYALDQDLGRPVRDAHHLEDVAEGPHLIKVADLRVLGPVVRLGRHEDLLVLEESGFHSPYGSGAPHEEGHDDPRKEDHVPDGKNGAESLLRGLRILGGYDRNSRRHLRQPPWPLGTGFRGRCSDRRNPP